MVVDDEPIIRRVFRAALVSEGCEVRGCADGQEAIDVLRAGARFDLIVCDLRMPRADGIEVGRCARELLPDCPLVFVSGLVDASDEAAIREMGAGLVHKPCTPMALRNALLEAVESQGTPR